MGKISLPLIKQLILLLYTATKLLFCNSLVLLLCLLIRGQFYIERNKRYIITKSTIFNNKQKEKLWVRKLSNKFCRDKARAKNSEREREGERLACEVVDS